LRAVTTEETDPDDPEPLSLHGLHKLTAAQQALAEFLEVAIDLLAGVGSGSQTNQTDAADDAACRQLIDLRDTHSQHATLDVFQKEFQKFMAEHSRRRALVQRLVKAGLWRN
jgi:hypothetical protein